MVFFRRIGIVFLLLATVGCGGNPEPPTTVPTLTPEQEASVKKATEGGGGPEMIRQMQQQGKTKPD